MLIGLDSLTGLQTARIFAARGVPVVAFAKQASHYCCWTRVCRRPHVVDTDSEALIEALETLGPQLPEPAVLVPCSDLSVLQISEHRDRLTPWYRMSLADHDVVVRLLNKARFIEFANAHDIPIPPSRVLRNRADVLRAAEELEFPCVLKPAVKTLNWHGRVGQKAIVLDSAEQLRDFHQRLQPWSDELVVQQWIDGPATNQFTCNCYFDSEGEPLVTFVTRKLRQWPPATGIGCFSEEFDDAEVARETERLFSLAGYRGLGYLEMKRDECDGRCYVVEPNIGRPTGRAAAAEAGGVELLMTAYCDALGVRLPEARTQRFTDIKWIHRRRDLQAAWKLWRQRELTASQWRKSLRGRKLDAVFQWSDWRPFVGDTLQSFVKMFRKSRLGRKPAATQIHDSSSRDAICREQVRWSD